MPTPCGLGLKSTVGTAVSVPPLGQQVKRQRRSDGPGTTKEGGGGKGRREDFLIFYLYIRDISNKNSNIVSPTFSCGSGTRRRIAQINFNLRNSTSRALVYLQIKNKTHATIRAIKHAKKRVSSIQHAKFPLLA